MSKYLNRNFRMAALASVFMQAVVESAAGGTGATPTEVNGNGAAEANAAAAAKEAEVKAETKRGEIKAAFNNLVDVKDTSFFFRKVTNEIKDPETGAVSKVETKRPTVVLPVPVPSVEGIIAILEAGGKGLDLLLEAAASVVYEQAREYVNENEAVTADNFPYDNMAWEKIANLPKAERRGGGISKELWEDFAKDYIEIMPAISGKKKESVEMAAKVFTTKFAGATTNKPVLKLLQGQLALYAANTTQGETNLPCIEFLQQKLEKLLNTDETNLLLAL